jgi:hypothetical protein
MKRCADCGQEFIPSAAHHRLCWGCWRAARPVQHPAATPMELDAELIGDLIQLAHPDRHPPERAVLANRTTATLLELRERARSAA